MTRVTRPRRGRAVLALTIGLAFALSSLAEAAPALQGVLKSVERSCAAGTPPPTALSPLLIRTTDRPARTHWVPVGERYASFNELTNPIFPERDHYISIHGGVRSPDEISIAFAPVFSASWTGQPQLFVPEGGGFDAAGNVYITPSFFSGSDPDQTNVIYAIDRTTGRLLWAIGQGQIGQGGVPMALGQAGQEIIHGGGYESLYAVSRDGTILWNTPTGLPALPGDNTATSHMYGVSYHQATDSIIAEYGSGDILAFDRRTGERWTAYKIDASPAVPSDFKLPDAITAAANAEFKSTFAFDSDESPMDILLDVALGNNLIIANYYGVDPNSSRIWVAATLKDGHPGDTHPGDGFSEFGALYGIDLTRTDGLTVHCSVPFKGGTASTPTVRADGKRVYTADAEGNALAFDTADCSPVWSVAVGSQIVGSLSASSVGGEIYASTANSVFKIVERGDSAAIVWEGRIAEAFNTEKAVGAAEPLIDAVKNYLGLPSRVEVLYTNFNLAATGENGVMIQAAAGVQFRIPPTPPATESFPIFIPLAMSMTLLDRETGRPVNSTPAVEETFAAITSGPQGATASHGE